MSDWQVKTPVAFIVFSRPDTTIRVFEEIRKARPPKLLVVADGPRADKLDEAEKCKAVRAIIETVDWPCEVLKHYSDVNLGCKMRVSSGLDWVFDQVEAAIILEDDCLPHPTFFRFCEELLDRYRDDERIGIISGDNFQFDRRRTQDSYYFSRYPHIWGWASWRRTWQKYDLGIKKWPIVNSEGWLSDIFKDKKRVKYWHGIFETVFNNKIDTWDYQLTFACWIHSMLNILPNNNLISNIGFGPAGTHTTGKKNKFAEMSVREMEFPLVHPTIVIRDTFSDSRTENELFIKSTIISRYFSRLWRILCMKCNSMLLMP